MSKNKQITQFQKNKILKLVKSAITHKPIPVNKTCLELYKHTIDRKTITKIRNFGSVFFFSTEFKDEQSLLIFCALKFKSKMKDNISTNEELVKTVETLENILIDLDDIVIERHEDEKDDSFIIFIKAIKIINDELLNKIERNEKDD